MKEISGATANAIPQIERRQMLKKKLMLFSGERCFFLDEPFNG
jgi:hypothetical protein